MEAVIQGWVDRFNARDWKGVCDLHVFPVGLNGRSIEEPAFIEHMSKMTSLFPSHRIDLDMTIPNRESQDLLLGVRTVVTTRFTPQGRAMFGVQPKDTDAAETSGRCQDLMMVRFESGGDGQPPRIREKLTIVDGGALIPQLMSPSPTLPDLNSALIRATVAPPTKQHDLEKLTREWFAHIAAKECSAYAATYLGKQVSDQNGPFIAAEETARAWDAKLSVLGQTDTEIVSMAVDTNQQLVATRYVMHTVLVQPFGDIQPNGRKIAVPRHEIFQFSDGKIIAVWNSMDLTSLKQQMS